MTSRLAIADNAAMEPDYIIGGITGEVAGAQRYSCSFCQADAWIGPASIKILTSKPTTKLVCLVCYVSNPKMPDASEVETQVSSREELVEALGVEKADFLVKNGPKMVADLRKKAAAIQPWKKN